MFKRLLLSIITIAMTVSAVPQPLLAAGAAPTPVPAPEAKGRIRAVIVAVAAYKEGIASPLLGTYNDAMLIAETLMRSGAKRDDLTILADKPSPELLASKGNPRLVSTEIKADAIATRDNILGALKKAAQDTRPGDEVLLSFSGHGVQQVEAVAGSEPDGLDEVFLPYDTGPPDANFTKVQNAVIDDEIGAAIDAIRSKGGNVTYIADFCHSGDSSRGTEGAAAVEPIEARLKLPPAKYASLTSAGFIRDLSGETQKGRAGWGAYVGMMAAPSPTQARQAMAPKSADRSEQMSHGLLSVYAMANWNNPRVVTYRDLANRITAGTDMYPGAPRPEFDGDVDRPLMGGLIKASAGGGSWAVYKPVTIDGKIDQLQMTAGQLQGVVPGTIVRLAIPGPQGDKTVLFGRVDKADANTAILVPVSFGDIPAERWADARVSDPSMTREMRLIATIEQQPVQLDYRVALPRVPSAPTPAQKAALAALAALKPADIGATLVPAGQDADLILKFEPEDKMSLRQPPGMVTASFGDIDLGAVMAAGGNDPELAMRLRVIGPALMKVARFSRLKKVLANPGLATSTEDGEDPAKALKVEFYVARPKPVAADAACPDTSADFYAVAKDATKIGGDGSEQGSFTFQRCDWLFVKFTNTGKADLYVNPLIFSPDGGILLFDGRDDRAGIKQDNPTRLRAGETGVLQYSLSDAEQGASLKDDLVVLVSDVTDGVPASYARLVQCPVVPGPEDGEACMKEAGVSLASTRLRSGGAGGTSVEDLIDSALIGSATRGGISKKPTAVSALRYSWRTQER
ncbi:caspase family protein [Sphingomonas sp.]|uniref:caspase family protein n=1 Tax=Sphingomonas sp. TaxID=28214 RepID=UPI001ED54B09|nr:caspase family protein [Sphingomonas sp.]MBX3594698.1 caspase family protein [Sphingomonas sp.]